MSEVEKSDVPCMGANLRSHRDQVNHQRGIVIDKDNKIKSLEARLALAILVLEYYLPILEETLSCGAYARKTLAEIKDK